MSAKSSRARVLPCALCGDTGQQPMALGGRVCRVPCTDCFPPRHGEVRRAEPDAWPMPPRWLVPALCVAWLVLVVGLCVVAILYSRGG